jgi:hypothetical protein
MKKPPEQFRFGGFSFFVHSSPVIGAAGTIACGALAPYAAEPHREDTS